jgi:hypothetical protein
MTTPSPVPSRRAADAHALRDFARLAPAVAVVLVLLLALPLAVIWLRVALDPGRYDELAGVIPGLWTWGVVAVTGVGLARLSVLWRARPPARATPVRTGVLACVPGVLILAALAVPWVKTG